MPNIKSVITFADVVIFPITVKVEPKLALLPILANPVVIKFPPVILPVATINPAVPILPILALPVTDKLPLAYKLEPLILPVAVKYPATLTPVPVATIIFELPATDVETLPSSVIFILLVPFVKLPAEIVLSAPK